MLEKAKMEMLMVQYATVIWRRKNKATSSKKWLFSTRVTAGQAKIYDRASIAFCLVEAVRK